MNRLFSLTLLFPLYVSVLTVPNVAVDILVNGLEVDDVLFDNFGNVGKGVAIASQYNPE